jgi:hypothetical protein
MQVVAFFSPARKAGRTLTLLALASGLIAEGKKVGVIKLTEEQYPATAQRDNSLHNWEAKINEANGDEIAQVCLVGDFESMIRALCLFEFTDVDLVLIDTHSCGSELVDEILVRSDLVVVPFTSSVNAASGAKWARKFNGDAIGLATGFADERCLGSCKKRFKSRPVFLGSLPQSQLFQRQMHEGSIFDMDLTPSAEVGSPIESALARIEALDACLATEALTIELQDELWRLTRRSRTEEVT